MRERVEAIVQISSGEWLEFADPARIVVAESPSAVRPALADVERLTRDLALHAVGFLTYEAGQAFDLPVRPLGESVPLAWFGLFEPKSVRISAQPTREGEYRLGPLRPSIERQQFDRAFDAIKGHLAAGDTYQVNFTFKMSGEFDGDPRALFADLIEAQRGRHSAFIRIGDWAICSASPELFFELDGVSVRSRPMKGTARRGLTGADDRRRRDELHESAKQRAENVMIVDMIRNDLGQVADVGSIEVPELFSVEQYPNVWQMTSLVTGRSLASLEEMFAAMHPSASVTGAPKVRTMALLSELESEPRGVYTGAVGHVPPDGNASFNVAIRTAVVDVSGRRVEFGVGSGIVWDSDAGAEYEECLLKGTVIGQPPARFDLLETMRWTPEHGYFLLDRHLERLREAADYFDFAFKADAAQAGLDDAIKNLDQAQRVRLLVARDGSIRVERSTLIEPPAVLRVAAAVEPVDVGTVWLYHKTTKRDFYEQARAQASGYDDVILWNRAGQVTEATTANVVAEFGGGRVTPPVECGLLAGTFRAELLARGEIRERVLTLDDLRAASRVWLINSVHEWREAIVDFGLYVVSGFSRTFLCLALATPLAAQQPSTILALMQDAAVRAALTAAKNSEPQTLDDQVRFCEVPAPPFKETARGEVLKREFVQLGLQNIRVDRAGNVLGDRPGEALHPHLVLSAHLDTVFPEETSVKVTRRGQRLEGPGIGDNCRGLAVLVAVIRSMNQAGIRTPGTVTFVANVGEEGLGDLRGMRALFGETMKDQIDRFVSIDNADPLVTIIGVGSHRYRVTFKGPGGHSFAEFGLPNPANALGRAIAKISEFRVTDDPRTTFNVGRVGGGTSVNAIPSEAWMEVDLRSSDSAALAALDTRFRQVVDRAVVEENARWGRPGVVTVVKELVGDRPAGSISQDAPIVATALAAARAVGLPSGISEGSTDANIAMSLRIPAITIGGGGRSMNAHTTNESFDSTDSWKGTQNVVLLTIALAR